MHPEKRTLKNAHTNGDTHTHTTHHTHHTHTAHTKGWKEAAAKSISKLANAPPYKNVDFGIGNPPHKKVNLELSSVPPYQK
jgi:hypothetical protein